MLNIGRYSSHARVVIVMSEIAVQAASTKSSLLEIARQAKALATGLQNAAPGDKSAPNPSIQYLLAMSEVLAKAADECDDLMQSSKPSNNLGV